MNRQKTVQQVRGYLVNCPSFEPCPFCYGCRAYDSKYLMCAGCAENHKYNICNIMKHQAKVLAQIMRRETIIITPDVADELDS